MTRTQRAPSRYRPIAASILIALLAGLSACGGEPEAPPVVAAVEEPPASAPTETVRSTLGRITLDATAEGQDVLGVQVSDERGVVNLHYSGPAARYVVCDPAEWLEPGGGVININLSENAAFETIDDRGGAVSVERWVRLDALSNVIVRSGDQEIKVKPNIRYIVSMVTEVYNLNKRVGHQAERLEFETGGSATTSSGHRCESTGALEKLAKSAAS